MEGWNNTSGCMGSWYQCINASVVDISGLLEDKQSLGGRICNIPFLDPVKVDRIDTWYLPWYFPMILGHGICCHFPRKIIK